MSVHDRKPAAPVAERRASLERLARLVQREAHILNRDAGAAIPHLHNMLFLREGESRFVETSLDNVRQHLKKRFWLRLINRPQLSISDQALRRVLEHNGAVSAIGWSPRGILACAEGEEAIVLWDPESGRRLVACSDHASLLLWSPTGLSFATATTFQTWQAPSLEQIAVHLRDQSGVLLRRFTGHTKEATSLAWSADGLLLACGSEDGTVRVWDAGSGECRMTVDNLGPRPVPTFSPRGGRIAIVYAQGEMVWNVKTGQRCMKIPEHPGCGLLQWSPSGEFIATAGGDVRVWNSTTGALDALVERPYPSVGCLAWSPDGRILAWTRAQRISCLDWVGRRNFALGGHQGKIITIAWSSDSRLLASATAREIVVWDVARHRRRCVFKAYGGAVGELAWSPDGHTLASSSGSTLCLWDTGPRQSNDDPRSHLCAPEVVVWSPEGSLLASMGINADFTVRLWNGISGRLEAILRGHRVQPAAIAWSPDGRRLASASGGTDQKVVIWDAKSAEEQQVFRWHSSNKGWDRKWVEDLAWSPDGETVALATTDGTVFLWNLNQGGNPVVAKASGPIAWSPDSRLLATTKYGELILWTRAGAEALRLDSTRKDLSHPTWSRDGRVLAASSQDGSVAVWRFAEHLEPTLLPGRSSWSHLALSMDGACVASGASDGVVSCWDTQSGANLGGLHEHSSVTALVFSPCGRYIGVGWANQKIAAWQMGQSHTIGTAYCLSPVRTIQFDQDSTVLRVCDNGETNGNRPIPYLFELCHDEAGDTVDGGVVRIPGTATRG